MSDDSSYTTPPRHRNILVVFVVVLPNGDVAVFDTIQHATAFSDARGGRVHEAEVNEDIREGVRVPTPTARAASLGSDCCSSQPCGASGASCCLRGLASAGRLAEGAARRET